MAQKQFKIGLSNTDKQNMAQDVYERLLALTFPEYETTESYEVGDFVVYNDQLYKCIGATSGAWDSTKWQLATLNDLVDDIENAVAFVNDKANVNGNYPTMTVGFADNLTPYDESAGDDQDEPFILQATGTGNGTQPDFSTGSGALMKEKQGNTVVVNQKVRDNITNTNCSKTNAHCVFTKTTAQGTGEWCALSTNQDYTAGHKYLLFLDKPTASVDVLGYWIFNGQMFGYTQNLNQYKGGFVFTGQSGSNTSQVGFVFATEADIGASYEVDMYLIDLTQWFNGDIPQDLLDNPSNFFRYYQGSLAYNTGTLVNANGRYIKCIGMNQCDEVFEGGLLSPTTGGGINQQGAFRTKNYQKVIPNKGYVLHTSASLGVQGWYICQYDANKNFIGNRIDGYTNNKVFTTLPNACYVKVAMYRNGADWDVNIPSREDAQVSLNLYYEDEPRCLTYEPYQVLTNNDTGNEVLRSAGSVKDYKTPDGTITRRVGSYTFTGNENWTVIPVNNSEDCRSYGKFTIQGVLSYIPDIKLISTISQSVNFNITFSRFERIGSFFMTGSNDVRNGVASFYGIGSNAYFYFQSDAFKNKTNNEVKALLAGLQINYELAEETTEQGTPYSENLVIDDFGSMDFGGTNGVPQGALIFYPVDYKAFIDTLYKYTDGTPSNIALKSDLSGLVEQQDLSEQIINKNANLTFSVASLIKQGRVHTLTVVADTNGNLSQGDALFTLPSGAFISGATYWHFALIRNTSTGVNTQESFYISNNDGGVKIGNNLASGNRICLSLSYIV